LLPWPNQFSAEKEFSFRIATAAKEMGHECLVLSGEDIASIQVPMRKEILGEFLINPHFCSSPIRGIDNLSLMWNSPTTVSEYRYGLTNVAASNYLVSGGSSIVDEYFSHISEKSLLKKLTPSLSNTDFIPNASHNSKLFYAGINWERITGKKTRHGEILHLLDRADLVDIYGPQKLRGVSVWQGFKNYQGEIKMDGDSLIREANRYGVSLALLNQQHTNWEMHSIRLSEAFAAQNIVIASAHPVLEFLGDRVFQIPSHLDPEGQVVFIGKSLRWVREFPELARIRATEASKIWFEEFELKKQLNGMINSYLECKTKAPITTKTYNVVILDVHNVEYLENLYLEIMDNNVDFVVHLQSAELWLTENIDKIVKRAEESTFFLTSIYLTHGLEELVHPAFESYDSAGPSYLCAEALILNASKLRANLFRLPLLSHEEFFERLLLGEFGRGHIFGDTLDASVSINYRFTLSLSIPNHFGIGLPGRMGEVSFSPNQMSILMVSKYRAFSKIKKYLPMRLKDKIRPLLLKYRK
jgi:hypothetical protein